MVPDLEPRCNSWIAVSPFNGRAVCETWKRDTAEALVARGYIVRTALQHLQLVNRSIKDCVNA